MEKPHYPLNAVFDSLKAKKVRVTRTALQGADVLGMDFSDICAIVSSLTMRDFYKSMTSYGNHHVWQDVYHPVSARGEIYLKLEIIEDLLILSFKELL